VLLDLRGTCPMKSRVQLEYEQNAQEALADGWSGEQVS